MGRGGAKRRDDEEEEEEDEDENPHRKRMRMFVDDEAEEDDEEDDDDEDDGDLHDLIDDEEVEAEAAQDEVDKSARQQRMRQGDLLQRDAEDIQEYVERRYGGQREVREVGSDDELQTTGIEQESLQPTAQDAKLFYVKCRIGREREAVIRLLQKHSNFLKKGQNIGITAAVAPAHIKGAIYVEAYKAESVKNAIRGLNVMIEKDMQLVPLNEMTEAMHVATTKEKTKIGDWVRVNRGLYTGDLGQVYEVHEGRGDGSVTLRLIPRINYASSKPFNDENLKSRPPQKLFEREEAERLSETYVEEKSDTYTGERSEVWKGQTFAYGMLYKRISARQLDTDIQEPQIEELELFQTAEQRMRTEIEELEAEAPAVPLNLSSIARQRKISFFPGDSVLFIRGDLKGLRGSVKSVEGEYVVVTAKELPEPVTCEKGDLTKSFKIGDTLKVNSGRYAGDSGTVVKVEGEIVVLFNDVSKEELKVLASNLTSDADLSAAPAGHNLYQLFDLVSLNTDVRSKGVVVKVSRDSVTLLDTDGNAVVKSVQEVRGRLNDRGNRPGDRSRHPISVGDSVKVIEGPHTNRHGVVKHTADNFIFFQAPDETRNCGLLVAPARSCVVQGQKRGPSFGGFGGGGVPQFKAPQKSFGGGFGGGGRGRGRDPIVRKEVKIKAGSYKGYAGRAVDASNDKIRVELEGICKVVTVPREAVIPKDASVGSGGFSGGFGGQGFGASRGLSGNRTPMHDSYGSRTPMRDGFGSRTPMHDSFGSRTPMHDSFGSRTPLHDGFGSRTPLHDSFGSRTPLHEPRRDQLGPRTPMGDSGSRTPLHNSFANPTHEPRTPLTDGWRPTTPAHNASAFDANPRGPTTPGLDDYAYREARTPITPGDPGTPAFLDARSPATPMMGPSTPYDPQAESPAEEEDSGIGEAKAMVNVEIEQDGKRAYIKELIVESEPPRYIVHFIEEGGTTEIAFSDLKPIAPEKNDRVCLLRGEASLVGEAGTIIGVERDDVMVEGIVCFENISEDSNVRVLPLSDLGKLYVEGE
ncbi:hypothetical protein NDN08_002490 [Rhodosorus marinus]|uniref:Transcription elongation factor SPT5 n=1 Tax=Rhodosorus marinus TaxID=101924 RepID=A0AAV8UTX2_9RHOD|nr:hypothetical protein NDN08_002490 [Rhodosorus marinus]